MHQQEVTVWKESISIPTYGIGKPEKNPMFLEKRVYQGSSGVVYPHAVIEKIEDEKKDKTYQALFLENCYLKIMVLPELGGRIQMAYDKVKNRHFIYYNQVVKPALVGLTGPWISGGIEFNWPQHHRPSTFEPIDYTTESHPDGSKTVWVSEVERMFRTKGMAGFTLYPDKAYLEIKGVLYNRTSVPQTFLWWANPAVRVNEHYQSVFPPDVYAVFDHGKRDVSAFPIAQGIYYKVNYAPGTDISRYTNIPVPTSYMAISSKYDFMGGYEHDSRGGLLHVANHHISPGKKQWTWGNGEFGYAWDRNLTDADGPYIELMTGVFTDNQPDFSWIMPNEERRFTQYFMPYSEIGLVKNASREAAINLEVSGQQAAVNVYVTERFSAACVRLLLDGQPVFEQCVDLSPEQPFLTSISLSQTNPRPEQLRLTVYTAEGRELIHYQPDATTEVEIPAPALAAKAPEEVDNNEQLYLTGLHIDQYRHATYVATDYYQEALRRDPNDSRANNAMGLWLYKLGRFKQAEPYFRTAIHTLTQRNPNPYDGEPYYNLGLCLTQLQQFDDAYSAFFKATWNAAWQDTGFLELARLAVRKKQYEQALDYTDRSLIRNAHSHNARHLKAVLLRKLNCPAEALQFIDDTLKLDAFGMGCRFEKWLIEPTQTNRQALTGLLRGNVHTYLEYALDYALAGLYPEAIHLLTIYEEECSSPYPMVYYFLAYWHQQCGLADQVTYWLEKGAMASLNYVFPNRLDECSVLQWVTETNPQDAHAPYLLGTFWYANRQYDEAITCWEQSAALDTTFPTVFRNLALAYINKRQDSPRAVLALEKAFELDTTDARVLMELDQLYRKLNYPHQQRLFLLEQYLPQTNQRDDLYLERITLYNQLGQYETARQLLASHLFHPWEGGEGKVVAQYRIAHLELAILAIQTGQYNEALELLTEAETYPVNLGEGKLYGTQENDNYFLKGLAYEGLGELQAARLCWEKAIIGPDEPTQAVFYNDQQPDKIVYQGLAWKKLGQFEQAATLFTNLIRFGETHLNDTIKIDYFAVSLPDLLVFDANLNERNRIHCYYLMGLGYLGLGNSHHQDALACFDEVLMLDSNHQGAALHRNRPGLLAG